MDPHKRNPLLFIALVAIFLALFYFHDWPRQKSNDHIDFMGLWTDPAGEPGNSMHFYTVPTEVQVGPLTAWEGRAVFKKHFGNEEQSATWNYGYTDPLQINVILLPDRGTFARIRLLDHDHMLIRFHDDVELLLRPDALDSPDTKRMTRLRDEAK